MIIDNEKTIRYIHSVLLGDENDAHVFVNMPDIGPEEELHFPAGLSILAYCRYPQTESLNITPYKTTDIIHQPRVERHHRDDIELNAFTLNM